MSEYKASLSAYMERKGVTQKELALFCNVTQSTVSKWINRKMQPSLDTVIALWNLFCSGTDEPINNIIACFT